MGARATLPGSTRGGERIPPLRQTRPRLIAAAAALALAGAAALYLLAAGPLALETWFAAAGLLLLLAAVTGLWSTASGLAAAVLAAGYVAGLYAAGRTLDAAAAPFGAALLLAVELAHLSLELGSAAAVEGEVVRSRLVLLGALGVGSAAAGLLLLPLAAQPLPAGLATSAAGLAAAVGAVALLAWLALREGRSGLTGDRQQVASRAVDGDPQPR